MKPNIDPKVDCVFKAILGHEAHKGLLVHFLNAVLQPEADRRIREVEILNPFNEREFESDKLSVVDIKARDAQGRSYQIEIQLAIHAGLPERILYTWSTIYHGILRKGQDFTSLRPVASIWLLNENLFTEVNAYHLPFVVENYEHRLTLTPHFRIHVLQLPNWDDLGPAYQELDRWMYLFKEGEELDVEHPPEILQTEEMREAMQVLQYFAENEAQFLLYQKRLDAARVEATWKAELERITLVVKESKRREEEATRRAEQERQEKEEAIRRAEQERQEKEEATRRAEQERQEKEEATRRAEQERQEKEEATRRAEQERQEKERLLALLKHAGIDPSQQDSNR